MPCGLEHFGRQPKERRHAPAQPTADRCRAGCIKRGMPGRRMSCEMLCMEMPRVECVGIIGGQA